MALEGVKQKECNNQIEMFLTPAETAAGKVSVARLQVARAPGHAFEKLMHFMPSTMHRHEAPADLFHMARIGATLVEDCGPCALTAALNHQAVGLIRWSAERKTAFG